MKLGTARRKLRGVRHRTGGRVMSLRGSRALTPFAAALAVVSVVGYMWWIGRDVDDGMKQTPGRNLAGKLLEPGETIGRVRPGGPVLTRTMFRRGDLIVTGRRGGPPVRGGVAVVASLTPTPVLFVGGGRSVGLKEWLGKRGGRFELLRDRDTKSGARGLLVERLKKGWDGTIGPLRSALAATAGCDPLPQGTSPCGERLRRWRIVYDDRRPGKSGSPGPMSRKERLPGRPG